MTTRRVLLGLGSNLGEREEYLSHALRLLVERQVLLGVSVANLYHSEAWLLPESPAEWNIPFLNTAVIGDFSGSAEDLLGAVKSIEQEVGRQDRGRWAPREIDIDILCVEGENLKKEDLHIPHLGFFERPFAFLPSFELLEHEAQDRQARLLQLNIHDLQEMRQRFAYAWLNIAYPTKWQSLPELSLAPHSVQRRFRSILPRAVSCDRQRAYTELVGIINLTPDSFSDGGLLRNETSLEPRVASLIHEGASVIDIGAESTRPDARPVSQEEELARLRLFFEELPNLRKAFPRVAFSLDTRHGKVAQEGIEAGIDWINDVSGGEDPDLLECVAHSSVQYVYMHHQGVPPRKDILLDESRTVFEYLEEFSKERQELFAKAGISPAQLIFDPGLGFGKSLTQHQALCAQAGRLREMLPPTTGLLYGHSRKSFLASFQADLLEGKPAQERDLETALLSAQLAKQGVDYMRVHAVGVNLRGVRVSYLTKKPASTQKY